MIRNIHYARCCMKTRNPAFDMLRIIAAFSVVVLHAAAHPWYYLEVNSWNWFIANAYDALFRFGVPIFVMISGALFLQTDKEVSLKRLYTHNIFRLLVVYGVWTLIYVGKFYVQDIVAAGGTSLVENITSIDWKGFVKALLIGPYHLWFLPMLVGIYMISPLLRRWISAAPRRELEYFLFLFFIFQVGITTLSCFVKTPEVRTFLGYFQPEAVCSYVGYFVLGHYLASQEVSPKLDRFLFGMAPVGCAGNVVISALLSRRDGIPEGTFFDSFGVFTLLISAALFRMCVRWMQSREAGKAKPSKGQTKGAGRSSSRSLLHGMAMDTLGIYMVHLLIMESPPFIRLYEALPVSASIPLVSVAVFLISLGIAAVLRRIPFIGRYIC